MATKRKHAFEENPKKKIKSHYDIQNNCNIKNIYGLIDLCNNQYKYYNNPDLINLHSIITDLRQIDNMVGLDDLKIQLTKMILYIIQHPYDTNMLHICINAEPGMGKTTISKIIARIVLKLKNWDYYNINIGTRTDLIAGYVGQSGNKTQKLIDKSTYGVLFIDEVYSLASDDSFSNEIINCLVHNLSEKKDWVCIIAGYESDNEYFFKMNKGLERRFPWKFTIKPYNKKELIQIFLYQIINCGWTYDKEIINTLNNIVEIHNFPNMGGSTENMLMHCKCAHSKRVFGSKKSIKKILNQNDILEGFELYKKNIKEDKISDDIKFRMYT